MTAWPLFTRNLVSKNMPKKLRTFTARASIEKGELVFSSPRFFKGMIQQFEDTKNVDVIVSPRNRSKSKEQAGYLWGVVYPEIAEHTGHSPEELHDIFKRKFLLRRRLWRGTELAVVGSTHTLTANEMAEFISKIILEAGEMEIAIPDPDKLYQFKRDI